LSKSRGISKIKLEVILMDKTFQWFTKADLTKYEDKYVSIVDEEVVFGGEDPEVTYMQAKKKYPDKEVVLWKVPQGDTFIFYKGVKQR
jgi:hypothetical protein